MSPSTLAINYGKAFGLRSLAAAIALVVLYVPMAGYFLLKSFTHPTYVHFVLTFFCAIRIAAFTLRAVMIGDTSVGENLSALIADQTLFGVGFFSLLYSAYTLVLDIESISSQPEPNNPIIRLTRNHRLFRLALLAAVALGIAAASVHGGSPTSTNTALHKASVVIFLILTALQALQTLVLAQEERHARAYEPSQSYLPYGSKYAPFILIAISTLLLVREAFSAATLNDPKKQNNERLWYPLTVLPEVVVVLLFSIPGLVPDRMLLEKRQAIVTE